MAEPASPAAAPMARWYRALAGLRAGAGRARLLVIGDSTSCGAGAGDDGPFKLHGAYARAWPQLLGQGEAPFPPVSANSLIGTQGVNQVAPELYDPRVSPGHGWAAADGTATLGGAMWGHAGPPPGALAFTPARRFDSVTIRYLQQPGRGGFTVLADGATLGQVTTAGAPAYATARFSSAPGTRSISIEPRDERPICIGAIETADSATPAIDVLQAAWFGARVANFAGNAAAWSPRNAIPLFAPHLTVINLTVNDSNNGTTPDDYRTRMQQIVTAARATGDVLLMTGAPSNTPQAADGTLAGFIAILDELARVNGCALLDLTRRWGSFADAQRHFPYADNLHPGARANQDQAHAVRAMLGEPG
jgi:lysophospholipase L1-like esterase